MYVFYGILGVDGLTGTGMELKKFCVLVDCVRIRGGLGRLLLGLCFGICLYFVQCTDDLDADINDCDIYGSPQLLAVVCTLCSCSVMLCIRR